MSHTFHRRAAARAAALICIAALFVTGAASTAGAGDPRPVKVMTRNLYLGADLQPAIAATDIPEFLAANAHIFSVVQQTNFPERAVALAREIADADPTLIGLQEVALWYSGPFNDPAPATTLEYDFLETLQQELATVGAPYEVVRVQAEADIEAPAGAPYFSDFRLVQRDVILVKAGLGGEVQLSNAQSDNFDTILTISSGIGLQIPVERGWTSVDVTLNRRTFRLVNTHLEAFHAGVRLAQAQELIAPTGPIGSAEGKVILAGDINSGPELPEPVNRLAFFALTEFGLVDTWAVANPGDPGFTSGFGELLDEPLETALEHRVDHVMTLGDVGIVRSRIYGTDPDNRTVTGMWPSDHAGVMATLTP
jgi:endonuclease/exonuclease/phosphatase family metal-dependent hydrolase